MSRARTAAVRSAGAATALLAAIVLVPGAASGEPDPGAALRELARASSADRAAADPAGGVATRAVRCFTDPVGDEEPAGEPRADVRAFCASNDGRNVGVSLTAESPTDPAGWQGITGIIWSLDLDGDAVEDVDVVYVAGTVQVEDVATGERLCETEQRFDGTAHSADFPAACIGSPDAFDVSAFLAFDSDPASEEVASDLTPFAGPVAAEGSAPPASGSRSTGRLAGSDRYGTAVAISQNVFPQGAPIVFLARADAYADALAGGSLSRGPVLLVPPCGAVPEVVKAEVRRLGAQEVVALGGPGAVCDSVLFQVASA